ncbi:MAG: hypothetical protein HW388_41 [Dehalococcoidia bacterium]|nr:hypothetical protein [Dehalococcoidia bacterium]
MHSPQEEAIEIFHSVLASLSGASADLKIALRQCFLACQILGWEERLSWFRHELEGYPSGTELPWYRKEVRGRTEWITLGGLRTIIASVVDDSHRTSEEPSSSTSMELRAGIDWILSAAQTGHIEPTGQKSTKYIRFQDQYVETALIERFDKQVFQNVLKTIENSVFIFVSQAYSTLRYGSALQDLFQAYRTTVEVKLTKIGLNGHLDTIQAGLKSDNPQDWRNVMWSCRDILHDLAKYLWSDPRDTYELLQGKGRDNKLDVSDNSYINRLTAYLHQKGLTGATGAYLKAETERIYYSIAKLNDLDSKAHSEITQPDARTAALGTYFILGELLTRTDGEPVLEYHRPT